MVADVDAISIKASVWNTAKARTKKPKKRGAPMELLQGKTG